METRFPPLVSFILKRLFQAIPTILVIITATFVMLHLAPGDPLYAIVGEELTATPEYMEQMREKLGLNRPLYIQYLDYVWNAIHGDLGFSILKRAPVSQLVMERLLNTLSLALVSTVLSIIIGISLGLFSAQKPYSIRDNIITIFAIIGYALPVFWFGQILISVFALKLGWLPVAGTTTIGSKLTGWELYKDRILHAFMPVMALTISTLAFLVRLTRSTMLNVLGEDYILTARSKGLDETTIILKHGFRNALIPLTTTLTLRLGFIISGALLTETVFAWPGIGRLTYDALYQNDYPLIMGIFIITCSTVVLAVLLADILYAYIDPRIRYQTEV